MIFPKERVRFLWIGGDVCLLTKDVLRLSGYRTRRNVDRKVNARVLNDTCLEWKVYFYLAKIKKVVSGGRKAGWKSPVFTQKKR